MYEIKANQSKLDYLIRKAKKQGIEFDLATSEIKPCFELEHFQVSTKTIFIRKIGLS